MALTFDSLATAKSRTLGFFRTLLGDWDLSSKGFFGKQAAVLTLVVYSWLRTARQIDNDAVPTQKTSTAGLDEWATNGTGISNGAGGYGRKVAVAASGGVGTFTGTPGTVYPDLSTLTASDGVTKYVLTNGPLTVPGGGSISGNINATTAGTAGNQPVSAVLNVDSVPVGGSSSVTLTTAIAGGLDQEQNSAVLTRVQDRLRNPPKAITAADIRSLAAGVSGVVYCYVYPRRNGTGTFDAMPVLVATPSAGSSGTERDPGDPAVAGTVAKAVDDAVKSAKNVTVEGYRTLRPRFAATGLVLVLRVTPAPTATSKYAFEWDSTVGGPFTVASWNGGTSKLTLNANASDLAAKIANRPRVQVITTGLVLPQQATATAYNAGTFEITFDPATVPAAWTGNPPQAGDKVHAGGPVVAPTALAVLSYVSSLGPSKFSGYADPLVFWDDVCRVDQLRRAALDVVDTDGTRMVIALPAAPTINGSATDVQATDVLTTSPEMLFTKSIAITP